MWEAGSTCGDRPRQDVLAWRNTQAYVRVIGFDSRRGWEFFSSPPRPERLWSLPSLLSSGYHGLFPWVKSGRGVKLTTHLHLVPRSRMRGTIPPLPSTSSWRGA
jgi:hypothetical protein